MASKAARDKVIRAAGARRVKASREAALRRLRDSSPTVSEALHAGLEGLETTSVYDILGCCAHVGRAKAEKILKCAGVWPLTHVGRLTDHERQAILRELPEGGPDGQPG